MFSRFKMSLPESWNISNVDDFSDNLSMKCQIYKSLDEYCLNGNLDVSALEKDWFPHIDAQVFLSHSHKDYERVNKLAAYLYSEFGLTCFVDSMVWGYSDKLLRKLNKKLIPEKADEAQRECIRNKNASFVYILLQSALTKMIDHCECIIFVNTPNSINMESGGPYTSSIWLYNELLMASRIRTKKFESYRQDTLSHSDINFVIPVEMDSFYNLTIEDLNLAKDMSCCKDDPNIILETLYRQKGLLKN